jgi:hypothetical protein
MNLQLVFRNTFLKIRDTLAEHIRLMPVPLAYHSDSDEYDCLFLLILHYTADDVSCFQ